MTLYSPNLACLPACAPVSQELVVAQDELAKVKQAARSDVRQLQLELVSGCCSCSCWNAFCSNAPGRQRSWKPTAVLYGGGN